MKSGVFDEQQVTMLLRLGRNMRAHQARVQDAMTRNIQAGMGTHDIYSFGQSRRMYAQAGHSVQKSEERIIQGCEELLRSLEVGSPEEFEAKKRDLLDRM